MSDVDFWDERWQVPARTIDMLGRQQIANIPTALHELFKNAHDAYAESVVADYFPDYFPDADPKAGLLIIRDDGDGMDASQLKSGWLTLASSSKRGANVAIESEVGEQRPRRAVMGEKGIGRLAIASIGPQVIILTRARGQDGQVQPLLVSLVHWGVARLPDIDLSRIVVPSMRIAGVDLPSRETFRRLADRLRDNVETLRTEENSRSVDKICSDLVDLDFDPDDFAHLEGPSLAAGGHGAHFVVFPTSGMLANDLKRPSDDEPTQMEKYLLGFSNTMMPDRPAPSMRAYLNVHRADGTVETPIGESEFFKPEEFQEADHAIEGAFDAYGHFGGQISVYGGEKREHRIAWKNATGRPTKCGPFRINFAYLQGLLKDSRLTPQAWTFMSQKLNRMGGLYVYRDGIRILPYGGPEQDFLGIERRRTKSAGDWFFSYRRIFGAVEITHAENRKLREKAGREGFIRDEAYEDFVDILTKFFETLAVDFFRDSSRHGDWAEAKQVFNRQKALLARRDNQSKVKRTKLVKALDAFFVGIEKGEFAALANDIKTRIGAGLDALEMLRAGADRESSVLDLEQRSRVLVSELEGRLEIDRPKGVGLSKKLEGDWESYRRTAKKVREEVVAPLREQLEAMVRERILALGIRLDRKRRIDAVIAQRSGKAVGDASRIQRKVEKQLDDVREGVRKTLREAVSNLAAKVEETQIEFLSTDIAALEEERVLVLQSDWEGSIEKSAAATTEILDSMSSQLASLMTAVARGETLDQTTDALESQVETYREQLDQFVELAQLGTAVGIVQHEFSSAVIRVRNAIRKLGPWARQNPDLKSIDRDLRDGFEHLDAYLNLFAPLSRRLTKTKVDLSGLEVRTYLDEVFGDRLRRHGVEIVATAEFDTALMSGQPSAVLASFVNLMDNAIHWMRGVEEGRRKILMDADRAGVTFTNTGPAIEPRIADRIFEFGETSREGGRGMGLYVSREALRRSSLSLTLEDLGGEDRGPTFRISPIETDETVETQA